MSTHAQKFLIVNADDFGLSDGTNAGIIEAHERGIVTSASLMVRGAAARAAADYARSHAGLSVGLHVDLGEWAFRGGEWVTLYEVVSTDDADAVAREIARQLTVFRDLLGRDPTHLDSHQHVHRQEPVRSILTGVAGELAVPLRHFDPRVQYCGDFYGQSGKGEPNAEAISLESLISIISRLTIGTTELCCHPGFDATLDSMYRTERAIEVRSLCEPRIRSAIELAAVELRNFANI